MIFSFRSNEKTVYGIYKPISIGYSGTALNCDCVFFFFIDRNRWKKYFLSNSLVVLSSVKYKRHTVTCLVLENYRMSWSRPSSKYTWVIFEIYRKIENIKYMNEFYEIYFCHLSVIIFILLDIILSSTTLCRVYNFIKG